MGSEALMWKGAGEGEKAVWVWKIRNNASA